MKEIAAAVASAVKDVKILGKGDTNSHGNYKFASIDKFLEMVNPICASHGLFPLPKCTGIEYYEGRTRNGASLWGRYSFDITLWHSSGEALPPVSITVPIQISGSQASGSAQSYALKQFFRGVLMIPTGDKDDADFNKPLNEEDALVATISTQQRKHLEAELERLQADVPVFLNYFKIENLADLVDTDYPKAIKMLEAKEKNQKETAAAVTDEETAALTGSLE